jgi:hypothetical protein
VQLNPDSAGAHYLLGLTALMADRGVEQAVDALKKAVELNRDNAAAHFVLANVYQAAGDLAQAAAHAGLALANRPASQAYRDFLRQAQEQLTAAPAATAVSYDLDLARRRRLSDLAEVAFHADRSGRLTLAHWTACHHPWRLIRRSPLLGSALLATGLYALTVALHLPAVDGAVLLRLGVPYVIVWMGLYFPFVVARMLERTYVRLLPAVNMPEDAFRRFFIRQSAAVLGGSCGLGEPPDAGRLGYSWRHNRAHLVVAGLCLPPLLVLQYLCANEPFWPLTPARAGLFAGAAFQVVAILWAVPLAIFCVLFIPRFYSIPVRYFLGMPAELSLASVGTFYVRLGWLSCVFFLFFLAQHYLFRTAQTVPLVSAAYVVLIAVWIVSIVGVSQGQLRRLLGRLKVRRVLEYSHHVEAAFEQAMKRPGPEAFAALEAHQRFLRGLDGLNTRGLGGRDLAHFLLLVACLLAIAAAYTYLVVHDLWLL